MNNDTLDNIRKNIKKYRLQNKMTQAQVAAELDLDTQYYAQLERGERNFTVEKIIMLCAIFKVDIGNIIELSPMPSQASEETLNRVYNLISTLSESQLLLIEKIVEDIKPHTK